jgi:hypothetical protein
MGQVFVRASRRAKAYVRTSSNAIRAARKVAYKGEKLDRAAVTYGELHSKYYRSRKNIAKRLKVVRSFHKF